MGEVSSLRVGRFMRTVETRPYMRARFGLAQVLEKLGRPDEAMEAATLLDRYAEDPMAVWRYGHALVTFRREGDSAAARDRLRANRRVAKYLDGAAALPDHDPETYAFGSEEEAVIAARTLAEAWVETPGAPVWLGGAGRRGGPKKRRR